MKELKEYRWKTQKGEVLTLSQMETSHIFNCMKMMFNHLASTYAGLTPVWFVHRYPGFKKQAEQIPMEIARHVVILVLEIQRRKDLPLRYYDPYKQILVQLSSLKRIKEAQVLLGETLMIEGEIDE